MRRILIAMEGASSSTDVIQRVLSRFASEDLMVFVLTIIPPFRYPLELRSGSKFYRWQSEEALVALDRVTSGLSRAGYPAFGLLRIGEPVESILAAALDLDVDVIVLGTQSRKGSRRLIPSRVAESVRSQAPCDVMVGPFDEDTSHGSFLPPAA